MPVCPSSTSSASRVQAKNRSTAWVQSQQRAGSGLPSAQNCPVSETPVQMKDLRQGCLEMGTWQWGSLVSQVALCGLQPQAFFGLPTLKSCVWRHSQRQSRSPGERHPLRQLPRTPVQDLKVHRSRGWAQKRGSLHLFLVTPIQLLLLIDVNQMDSFIPFEDRPATVCPLGPQPQQVTKHWGHTSGTSLYPPRRSKMSVEQITDQILQSL